MTNKPTLSLTLLLSLSSACGLIKVNGKPLGGGGSSGTTSSSEPSSSSNSSSSAHPDDESHEEYEARQHREIAEQNRQAAAEKAGQPEMCSTYGISNSRDIKLEDFAEGDPRHDWKLDARDFAEVMCSTRGKNLELRPKVMALRTKWMTRHGLDENDFLVVLVEGMGRGWKDQSYGSFPGPISQIAATGTDAGFHVLDELGSKASMLARVSFVERCLQIAPRLGLLQNILCTSETLDAAKANAEIEATPDVNIQTRFHLRQMVRKTVNDQAEARAALAKDAKDDPGISKLIAITEAQRKEWAAPTATRSKLIQLVEAMEAATDTKKRSAFAGCEATTRAAWTEIVKAAELPNVSEQEVLGTMQAAVFKSAEAYLAYRAFALCADGSDAAFPSDVTSMSSAYARRGARSSTIAAWMAAAGDIKFDSKELEITRLLREIGGSGSWGGKVTVGVIDKVTAKGNDAWVSFKKDIVEFEDCIKMKSTGRISRIESNGAISYEQTCLATGMVKWDRTPEDARISGFLAHDLKQGMLIMVTSGGFPIVATTGSKSKKASWLFGVALGK